MNRGYVRLKRRAPLTVPLDANRRYEPPACNVLTRTGKWCMRDEMHRGGHLPLPANYPPQDVTA